MTSVAANESLPPDESAIVAPAYPNGLTIHLSVLLAINFISLPAFVLVNYLADYEKPGVVVNYFYPLCGHVMTTQVFLLAFWLSFGGVPTKWRALLIVAFSIVGGIFVGIGLVIVGLVKHELPYDDNFAINSLGMITVIPVIVCMEIWLMNTVFVIPSWLIGMEISYPKSAVNAKRRSLSFGIGQLLSWTAQVALPLGLVNAVMFFNGQSGVFSPWSFASYLVIIACCTPMSMVLLIPRLSAFRFALVMVWVFLVGGSIWLLPSNWDAFFYLPTWSLAINIVVVAANCLALRFMGLSWQPRVEPNGHPHA